MESADPGTPGRKINWGKVSLNVLLAFGVVFLILLLFSLFDGDRSQTNHVTTSELINKNEIAKLSVSEFVYNGIARTYKENGERDYNVLYNSTVKVGIDADSIDYAVDEDKKTVTFIFPEIEVGRPMVDEKSIRVIPDRNDLHPDGLISLCRADAFEKTSQSEKLLSSAQENLKSIMEAWYSPVFEGYSFEYQFGAAEGGDSQ